MINLLEKEFIGKGEVKGVEFKQVFANERFYIYQRGLHLFEVFERKTTPLCIDFAKKTYSDTDSKEIYPKSNNFGVWAWCCGSLEKAMERVTE